MPDWLVQIPDKRDPSGGDIEELVLQARRDNFTVHAAHNKRHVEAGHVVVSGPLLASHDEPLRPVGSVMVWKADSESQVRAWLEEDPYAKANIWDLARTLVTPYFCAVRTPM